MKEFNFKKLGILITMMLVGAMILVGPASAYSTVNTGDYILNCAGTVGSSTTSIWALAYTTDGYDAEHIVVTAVLYNEYGNYVGYVTDDVWDYYKLKVSKTFSGAYSGGYVDASFDAVDPNDSYYGLIYDL